MYTDDEQLLTQELLKINKLASIKLESTLARCLDRSLFEHIKTVEELRRVLHVLIKSGRYQTICGHYAQEQLVIMLNAAILFNKLYIYGNLLHKERLKTFYPFLAGDPWDEKQHHHGIIKIQDILKSQGYLSAHIDAQISKDEETQSITVYLTIDPADQYTIDEVQVTTQALGSHDSEDMRRITQKIKKKLTRALKKTSFSQERLDNQLRDIKKNLYDAGFINAKIDIELIPHADNSTVMVHVHIITYQKKIFEIIGNYSFSNYELFEILMRYGKQVLLLPSEILIDDLLNAYREKGFLQTKITFSEEDERHVFCIEEGNKATITHIDCKGNDFFSTEYLDKTYLASLCKKTVQISLIKKKLLDIQHSYQERGFWDAYIDYSLNARGEEGTLLTVTINEGAQRKCVKESIEGLDCSGSIYFALWQSMHRLFPLTLPQPLNLFKLHEKQAYILNELHKQGFLHALVKPQFIGPTDALEVVWTILRNEQPTKTGFTVLVGPQKTPEEILRRELVYQKDDIWDGAKINRSLKRLRSLGIFDSVSFHTIDTDPYHKEVIVQINEDDIHELKMRGGLSCFGRQLAINAITYTFGGTYCLKNALCRAERIVIQADANRFQREISLSYTEPQLGQYCLRPEYKVYSTRFNEPLVPGSKHTLYRLAQDGFLACFHYDYEPGILGLRFGCEWMKISDISHAIAHDIFFEPRLINNYVLYITAEPTFYYDNLDNKLYPHAGIMTLAALKLLIPTDVPRAFAAKILVEQSFFNTWRSITAAIRLRAGHIVPQSFSRVMPSQRFYLGGAFSLRGYDTDHVPPLHFAECNGKTICVPIGGKSMININAELRFPFWASIHGVSFIDIGSLGQNSFADICLKFPAVALGIGLRYHTAVGPIRFDLGWNVDAPCSLKNCHWFLTIGQIF